MHTDIMALQNETWVPKGKGACFGGEADDHLFPFFFHLHHRLVRSGAQHYGLRYASRLRLYHRVTRERR